MEPVTNTEVSPDATQTTIAPEDQAFMDMVFGGADEPAPSNETPSASAVDAPAAETKPDEAAPAEDAVDADLVQVSKSDWMRLMTLEAQQKMAQTQNATAPETAPAETPPTETTPQVQQQTAPAGIPEFAPLPINLDDKWVDAFGFQSKEQGDAYIGTLINVPLQKAVEYTQSAIAAMRQEFSQQLNTSNHNSGLFMAVNQVLKDRPEYRGDHMAQVEYAAREAISADPSLTVWDLPDAIIKRLDASAAKAKQIMASGGKINAVPQGGAKAGSTGARAPQDTGRGGEPEDTPEKAFLKLLSGFEG